MLLSKKTSTGVSKGFFIKVIIILIIITSMVVMLGKIDFPSPNNEIKNTIPNEKLKIVK